MREYDAVDLSLIRLIYEDAEKHGGFTRKQIAENKSLRLTQSQVDYRLRGLVLDGVVKRVRSYNSLYLPPDDPQVLRKMSELHSREVRRLLGD